ncbi:MAG: hypothetical protein ACFBRM_12830 [Pikeienuella sp.]
MAFIREHNRNGESILEIAQIWTIAIEHRRHLVLADDPDGLSAHQAALLSGVQQRLRRTLDPDGKVLDISGHHQTNATQRIEAPDPLNETPSGKPDAGHDDIMARFSTVIDTIGSRGKII